MGLLILLTLIVLALIAGLVWFRRRDDKFLKKPTKEAIRKGLRQEFEKERQDALRRKQEFEKELKKYGF